MIKTTVQDKLFVLLMLCYPAALFWIMVPALLVNRQWFWHWSFAPLAMVLATAIMWRLFLREAQRAPALILLQIGVFGPGICVTLVFVLEQFLGAQQPLPNWLLVPQFLLLLALLGTRAWKTLRRDAAGSQARLRRLGTGLGHLARLGQGTLVIYALLFLLLLHGAAKGSASSIDTFYSLAGATLDVGAAQSTLAWAAGLLRIGHGWVVSVALGAVYAVQLWTLQQLHALGQSLLRSEPLSDEVAARFRTMAHAILAFVLADALLPGLLGWPLLEVPYLRFSMAAVFAGGCAVVCLYAIAILIEEGSRLANENRAFV